MNLTGKQRRYLRSIAHNLKPVFQIGKDGVNDNLISQIDDYLEIHEILKVSILQNSPEDKNDVAEKLALGTHAHVAQIIGKTIVLYRESKENKEIKLP
ncbi:ribosome assembly RNA-binding protein YhbY [Phocicoccus pinnipedialis]|uniref:RNA-binding protein YhbY n=1 Tax=Phocicoccus pinnipedialis TaxID=110845 RepID=A0A6V7RF32_9BACL|nr:ribosome assembly RNA-binding protein YhbY [Jeotgalicoccus pinnipedialis]MBP1939238.1 RNA-binding protein [Jeotgalicoccus pinnipedialis]CAD2076182.1 RNA-binding protein YhbY [Jeotgalicoccus pinnipedialis]